MKQGLFYKVLNGAFCFILYYIIRRHDVVFGDGMDRSHALSIARRLVCCNGYLIGYIRYGEKEPENGRFYFTIASMCDLLGDVTNSECHVRTDLLYFPLRRKMLLAMPSIHNRSTPASASHFYKIDNFIQLHKPYFLFLGPTIFGYILDR